MARRQAARWRRYRALGLAIGLAVGLNAGTAQANIFTHILREAGEAGGKAAGHAGSHVGSAASHLGPVGRAASHLKAPGTAKGALAAHATPEGHWQFVNREGQVFTAGTADEMQRVMPTLSLNPAAGEQKMALYLSEDSVFANRAAFEQLPKNAELHVVTDHGAFAITRNGAGNSLKLTAQVKPNLTFDLTDRVLFDEAVAYLGRQINKSNIRTIALEPGAAKYLSSAPKLDPASKLPQVDVLDPANLANAFSSIRGQTALLTGRVENGKVFFSPSKGAEISRDLEEITSAAARHDVNLVILQTDAARQPGGRNWLWQKFKVGGLGDASKAGTVGDFLDALGARRGGLQLSGAREGTGRIQMAATPSLSAQALTKRATSAFDETVGHVTGEIITKAAEFHFRDEATQKEYDARWIPGIPSGLQIMFLVGVVAGLIGWATSRAWFARIWAPRSHPAGAGRPARILRALPRELAFMLVFLPMAGLPAMIWQAALQTWESILAPFRWLRRRFLRREV